MDINGTDIMTIMRERHSVRAYLDRAIEPEVAAALEAAIAAVNDECDLHMQLILDEPRAFQGPMARYGKFSNVKNYIAVVGRRRPHLDEDAGYGGEKIVLKAQQLGLNTCWVGLTYSKRKSRAVIRRGEKLICVIAVGYGENDGHPHKSKTFKEVSDVEGRPTSAFRAGIEAALLAPTAVNQQKFRFFQDAAGDVYVKSLGGFYSAIDLGIVTCHFELATGIKPRRS